MTSGPIVVQVLEGEDAIDKYRKVMGATDPAEAKRGTHPQAVCPVQRQELGARLRQPGLGRPRDCIEFSPGRNCRMRAAAVLRRGLADSVMARVRFYVATSLDGFIADREGSVDWLAPYDARLYGYDKFLAEVGALVMGRRTYEMISATGEDWPYAGKPVFVLVVAARSATCRPASSPTTRGMLGGAAAGARDDAAGHLDRRRRRQHAVGAGGRSRRPHRDLPRARAARQPGSICSTICAAARRWSSTASRRSPTASSSCATSSPTASDATQSRQPARMHVGCCATSARPRLRRRLERMASVHDARQLSSRILNLRPPLGVSVTVARRAGCRTSCAG